jgi:REP element-mobilizing transposase RayT
MARPLRIEFPGAWYHVMNRGTARQAVFTRDTERSYFLALLADTCERFDAEWHAYCLMGNHYHLMVRTPQGNLARIMRHIDGLYTQHCNRRRGRDGALFRGRYRSILIDAEAHWLALSRYIHRNPLEAGLVRTLSSYRPSSYRAYAGYEPAPPWLTTAYILKAIGQRAHHQRYRAYVAGDTDEALAAFYRQAKLPPILGDEAFRARVLAGRTPDIDHPELRAARVYPSHTAIVAGVCRRFRLKEKDLYRSRRGRAALPARAVAMYLCQQQGGLRLAEVAEVFGLASYASASATIRLLKRRLQLDAALAKTVKRIILDLTP